MKYDLKDDEKDVITNSYLMSLAVFVTTMPIPVINLIANLYFYFTNRKSSYVIRWHAQNSLFSQIPLFFINSFTWYVVWQILWGEMKITDWVIAYLLIARCHKTAFQYRCIRGGLFLIHLLRPASV